MMTGMKNMTRANLLTLVSFSSSSARIMPKRFWKTATSTAKTIVIRNELSSVPD